MSLKSLSNLAKLEIGRFHIGSLCMIWSFDKSCALHSAATASWNRRAFFLLLIGTGACLASSAPQPLWHAQPRKDMLGTPLPEQPQGLCSWGDWEKLSYFLHVDNGLLVGSTLLFSCFLVLGAITSTVLDRVCWCVTIFVLSWFCAKSSCNVVSHIYHYLLSCAAHRAC